MKTLIGDKLTATDRAYVLSAFVHRFTAEHIPAWAKSKMPNGNTYPVQFASDADWLANTYFNIRKNGRLDRRSSYCHSNPTWPNNPELRTKAA